MEYVWKEVREKESPNQAFKSLRDVKRAICREIDRPELAPFSNKLPLFENYLLVCEVVLHRFIRRGERRNVCTS